MPTDLPPTGEKQPNNPRSNAPDMQPSPEVKPPEEGGGIRIATFGGISVRLHWTFIVLLFLELFTSFGDRSRPAQSGRIPFENLLFVVGLFFCVALHEIGHAVVASRYGIRTREIVLYPLGGVSRLETMPRARQELWIALAGPFVNLGLAVLLYIGLRIFHHPYHTMELNVSKPDLWADLLSANLAIFLFNLIPAFPLDGGRVLRALIARATDEAQATAIAARIGQIFALGLGIYALYSGTILLVLVAVFIYLGAGQAAALYQTRVLSMGHRVQEAMLREFHTLPVGATLGEAAEALLAGSQHDFPVVHGGEVVGVLSRTLLMRGFAEQGPESYVAGVMLRDFSRVQPDEELETVLEQMPSLQQSPILVMEGTSTDVSALRGMITQENLVEFLMLTQLRLRINPPA